MVSNEGLFDEGSGSDREEGLLVTSKPPEPVYENDSGQLYGVNLVIDEQP